MKIKAVSKSQRKSSIAPQAVIEKRPFKPDPPMLPSDMEDAELTETELDDQESVVPSSTTASELGDDDDDEAYSDEHEDDNWTTKTPKAKQPRSIVPVRPPVEHAQPKGHSQAVPRSSTNQIRDAKLAKYMDKLKVDDDDEEINLPVVKKKKRSVLL